MELSFRKLPRHSAGNDINYFTWNKYYRSTVSYVLDIHWSYGGNITDFGCALLHLEKEEKGGIVWAENGFVSCLENDFLLFCF